MNTQAKRIVHFYKPWMFPATACKKFTEGEEMTKVKESVSCEHCMQTSYFIESEARKVEAIRKNSNFNFDNTLMTDENSWIAPNPDNSL